jgi:hypothetical protein
MAKTSHPAASFYLHGTGTGEDGSPRSAAPAAATSSSTSSPARSAATPSARAVWAERSQRRLRRPLRLEGDAMWVSPSSLEPTDGPSTGMRSDTAVLDAVLAGRARPYRLKLYALIASSYALSSGARSPGFRATLQHAVYDHHEVHDYLLASLLRVRQLSLPIRLPPWHPQWIRADVVTSAMRASHRSHHS